MAIMKISLLLCTCKPGLFRMCFSAVMLALVMVLLHISVIVARENCYPLDRVRVVNNAAGNNTVEVCRSYYGQLTWHLVCSDGWDCGAATVACREILNVTNPRAILSTSYYRNSTTHYRTRYTCRSGTEQSLSLCSATDTDACYRQSGSRWYQRSYRHPYVAHVVCIPPRGCPHHGAIRLFGGETNDTGRLELCYNGEWYSVRPWFNYIGAATACRQLGFTEYPRLFTDGRFDSVEPRSRSYSNIRCNGYKETLLDCQVTNSTASSCMNYRQIGLQCYAATTQCSDGAVRLVGGRIEQEGRVEVCLKGIWGSMCRSQFTNIDLYVTCSYLGYHGNRDTFRFYGNEFGSGEGPVLQGFDCQGWEQNMAECFNSSQQYENLHCNSDSTTAVRCSDFCRTGDVRLVGGPNSTSGIVEFCNNNLWGLIAEPGWSDNNAGVVCKQLGLERGGVAVHNASHLYTRPKKLIHLANVFCRGSENVISECASYTNTLSAGIDMMKEVDVAGVVCQKQQSSIAQSLGVHMVCQSPSPAVQQSSNFTQSPAGVNMNPSPVPSVHQSVNITKSSPGVVHINPTLAVHQSASSTAQSLAGSQMDSSPVVQLSTMTPAQSPTLEVQEQASSSQQMMVQQNNLLFTISVIMGLICIILLLLLGSVAAIAAVLWARTRKASDSPAGNLPAATDKEKF